MPAIERAALFSGLATLASEPGERAPKRIGEFSAIAVDRTFEFQKYRRYGSASSSM